MAAETEQLGTKYAVLIQVKVTSIHKADNIALFLFL